MIGDIANAGDQARRALLRRPKSDVASAADDDRLPFLEKALRQRQSDAGRAAGDQNCMS